jgi:phosphoribosylformylglycinamidine synthase
MSRLVIDVSDSARGSDIQRSAGALGIAGLRDCRVADVYCFETALSEADLDRICGELLVDPVVGRRRTAATADHTGSDAVVVEVARRPGVTDVTARELARGATRLGIEPGEIAAITRFELHGDLSDDDVTLLATSVLANETIEDFVVGDYEPRFGAAVDAEVVVDTVPIRELDDDALMVMSRERVMSLDLAEMTAIADFYRAEGRDPYDAELETLAQTWSEHCCHKTFGSDIEFTRTRADGRVETETVHGMLKVYLRDVTEELAPEWLHSAFVDNAGIISFDDELDLAIKVETHNHPSALEPFGGANTGVGGVVRDIMGVSARPIAALDVLCFGPGELPHSEVPDGVLHPERVARGVVAGVGDYGNKLGLPTVAGAVLYDRGYLGNPLVFCGSVGVLPHGSNPTEAAAGDLIVSLGGRTGRDGIHGATFSSAELAHDTAEVTGSAVQIGDPITEKGVLELIEEARDQMLYSAITDCGAGGYSSAVGEMGEKLGAQVELANVPLKYPGLRPWEIYLSEAQERMVLAVPPGSLAQLEELAKLWRVEVTVLGHFTGDGRLDVRHGDTQVVDIPMAFLHDGRPKSTMVGAWTDPVLPTEAPAVSPEVLTSLLTDALSDPNVASKEDIVRTYDHEVRGGTVVRPFCGPAADGPTDAAVCKPLGTWHHDQAFSLGIGINPRLGRVDPHAMAIAVVDEAIRNAVAVGSNPDRVALIDNFCWGNPTIADRLGGLVLAGSGCRDAARAYNAPFISGKDSLFNEFEGEAIPGTLLVTALGLVPDINRVVTSDLKATGNALVLVGRTGTHLAGTLVEELLDTPLPGIAELPGPNGDPLVVPRALHGAILDGQVVSAHDLSEGGLGVAAAEMCIAGRRGAELAVDGAALESLYAESLGRFLVEVAPADAEAFVARFPEGHAAVVGSVSSAPELAVTVEGHALRWALDDLVAAFSPGSATTMAEEQS